MPKKRKTPAKPETLQVFESSRFTPEMLEDTLWDTLKKVQEKKMEPAQANAIIGGAKEICNLSRLRLQYHLLNGPELPELPNGHN